jgi:hypothetical protein
MCYGMLLDGIRTQHVIEMMEKSLQQEQQEQLDSTVKLRQK